MRSRYHDLTRAQLAILVPELLLIGHLIDRSGMAWCVAALGREAMTRIAIEEWALASPIYTRRMQCALGYAPPDPGAGDVLTIFQGLQLDIGAPPQFLDFRFTVHDRWHGEFHLDHCGALMDVEPMGAEYVRASARPRLRPRRGRPGGDRGGRGPDPTQATRRHRRAGCGAPGPCPGTATGTGTGAPIGRAADGLAPLAQPRCLRVRIDRRDAIVVPPSAAHEDGAWVSLCGPEWTAPLQAIVRALEPHLDVSVTPYPAAGDRAWRAAVVRRPEAAPEAEEVTVDKFSTGTTFTFQPRRSLPLTPR